MKALFIIPAYNESENIERVVEELKIVAPESEYIIVNDGSRDCTAEICRAKNYSMLDLPANLGLAGAFQAGIRYAYEHGYDCAMQLDGDGQHDPQYIKALLSALETGDCDMVIGSRFVTERKPKSLRMMGSFIIGNAIKLTTGITIHDPTSGMRVFSRRLMKSLAYEINYGPEPDTVAYLLRSGVRVKEVQVTMRERVAGESYLTLARSIRYMIHMCTSILLIQWFRERSQTICQLSSESC